MFETMARTFFIGIVKRGMNVILLLFSSPFQPEAVICQEKTLVCNAREAANTILHQPE